MVSPTSACASPCIVLLSSVCPARPAPDQNHPTQPGPDRATNTGWHHPALPTPSPLFRSTSASTAHLATGQRLAGNCQPALRHRTCTDSAAQICHAPPMDFSLHSTRSLLHYPSAVSPPYTIHAQVALLFSFIQPFRLYRALPPAPVRRLRGPNSPSTPILAAPLPCAHHRPPPPCPGAPWP